MDQSADSDRHAELGRFLVSRRVRLNPASFGLPVLRSGHRRTPGLRREDVSAIAGISTAYYTWIEQGRPFNISADVLYAIAGALRLTDVETRHVFALAGKADMRPNGPAAPSWSNDVMEVVERLDGCPAFTLTPWLDIVGGNAAAHELVRLVPGTNLAWWFFCADDAQLRPLGRDEIGSALVALLRRNRARNGDTAAFERIVARLSVESERFRTLWEGHVVDSPPLADVEFDHAARGRIAYRVVLLCEPVALSRFVLLMTPHRLAC